MCKRLGEAIARQSWFTSNPKSPKLDNLEYIRSIISNSKSDQVIDAIHLGYFPTFAGIGLWHTVRFLLEITFLRVRVVPGTPCSLASMASKRVLYAVEQEKDLTVKKLHVK